LLLAGKVILKAMAHLRGLVWRVRGKINFSQDILV
jgi:hypothetical protein